MAGQAPPQLPQLGRPLAGGQAVADPLHVPLTGAPAKVITRGYHLLALPANRLRVVSDWCANLLTRRQVVQFGLIPAQEVSLAEADRLPHRRVPENR